MATFQNRVEALTQFAFGASTDPSEAELTEFLNDGVLDVTEKWLIGHPQDRESFMNETTLQVAQGADIGGADIISVVRADGVTAGNFRPCRKIPAALQSQVLDTESLSFASKYHPVYMVSGSNVKVFPVPSDNSGKDSYKVLYVNNTPKDSNGTSLTYTDSALGYFPADKVYLVVLYAAAQTVKAAAGSIVGSLGYTAPTVGGTTEELTTSMTALADDLPGTDIDFRDFSKWFTLVGEYIEDNQDIELAGAQLQKISTYLQTYQGALQNLTGKAQVDGAQVAAYQQLYVQFMQEYITAFQIQQQQPAGAPAR